MRVCVLILMWVSFGLTASTEFDVDLGDAGNKKVADAFSSYQTGCWFDESERPRVLLTGFGPFRGESNNISGRVATQIASGMGASFSDLPITTHGGWAYQGIYEHDGVEVSLCVLYLDVVWDLAAAIITKEANTFQPDFILMTGRGGQNAVFEAGAINQAAGLSGFDASGKALGEQNHPWCETHFCDRWDSTHILDPTDSSVEAALLFGWDNVGIKERVEKVILSLLPNVEVWAPKFPRASNDYICNNVSYVLAHLSQGRVAKLAGGKVLLDLNLPTRVGFFHYPISAIYSGEWEFVIKEVIGLQF